MASTDTDIPIHRCRRRRGEWCGDGLIELHLNSLETVRERERFFADNGIKLYTDEPAPNEVTGKIAVSGDPSQPFFRLDTALRLPVPA